ncbi:ABC transporter permease [Paenibacillus alginolyticus]|uniref:ABC transporter permease n=1 Tax=Paenibacillus alginolyticus TaxID=59839 RepID=UPI000422834D|nr:ABC transporter permease [Paenibacillus alginolyticus]MCY9669534.1 ABC transporter permease [Paenibacillus alginolyticus]
MGKINKMTQKMGRELGLVAALIIMIAIFGLMNPIYLSPDNLLDIVDQSTINGLLALGITFVIITGGIDLSIGSIMAIVIVSVGLLLTKYGMSPVLSIVLGLVIGALIGAMNGLLVTKIKLQPFIATLATMSAFRGVAYIITKGWPVLGVPVSFRAMMDGDIMGFFPIAILILIAFALIGHILLKNMRFGTFVYAIGGNEEATKLSGVNVDFNKTLTYAICGIGAALAGMVMLARLGTGEPTAGQGYELNAIAAAAIGGTSLAGGKGSMVGTLLGVLLLSALKTGLVVVGVDAFWQYIATGAIIAVAAYFEIIQGKFGSIKSKFSNKKAKMLTP